MTNVRLSVERSIGRCRAVLSVCALVAIYVDPTEPPGGLFTITPVALGVVGLHLVYSLAVQLAVARQLVSAERLAVATAWADVAFATAIAMATQGTGSPFYVFFSFALVAVGFRSGLRLTAAVTTASVLLYLGLLLVSPDADVKSHIMRPVYLAVVGYMGEQDLNLQARVRELEAAAQRNRIARSLHDGYAQALAGVNLRLETCRELLRRGRSEEASGELAELQRGVTREFDHLRAYIRSLASLDATPGSTADGGNTRITVRADFTGSAPLAEHVLCILHEGVVNVRRHARARAATIAARGDEGGVRISLDDDGVGFPAGAAAPWSIASRVDELGGSVEIGAAGQGAHLVIDVPAG
jgi:signal transduction histidine kinase